MANAILLLGLINRGRVGVIGNVHDADENKRRA